MRLPDHLTRADIGAYMRDVRLHYRLSEQDVSERLHIRPKYVTAIESAQFDAMPGRAYARGYVHTYAEFLGLDADHVVERCFDAKPEPVTVTQHSSNAPVKSLPWKMIVLPIAAAVGIYLAMQQDHDASQQEPAAIAAVQEVPDDYLDSLRTARMPSAESYECLNSDGWLGCIRAQRTSQMLILQPLPDMSPAPSASHAELRDDASDAVDAETDDAEAVE